MGKPKKYFKGHKFNKLTILEDGNSHDKVLCQCECGNQKMIIRKCVTSGHTKSCGCLNHKTKSYKGQKFNKLTILEDGKAVDMVLCQCECGNKKRILQESVTRGKIRSCGCLMNHDHCTKHGMWKTEIYRAGLNCIQRCHNPNNPGYVRYGGRGYYVCQRWREPDVGHLNFINDMADTWFKGAHLDKDKFAKPGEPKCYSPETCCWLTHEENQFIRDNPELYPIRRDSGFDPFISYKLATT